MRISDWSSDVCSSDLIGMFRPWLDPTYARPSRPGDLRWFVTDPDAKDMEVDGPTPIELDGKTLIPQSRTFIQAALRDNPYMIKTGYQAQLDALPEPLRPEEHTNGLQYRTRNPYAVFCRNKNI